jgi:hypothetical protein
MARRDVPPLRTSCRRRRARRRLILVLSTRQKVALVAAALYVLLTAVLAVASFDAGAWVRGAVWAVSAAVFAVAYGVSWAHWRRA